MFSQTAEYALRAMAWLALSEDELVPTATLAEHTKVPSHYLAKVLQQLAQADLITGRRGVRGGYRLSRPPSKISLRDVVSAVSPLERITTCPLGLKSHGKNLCPLHTMVDQIIEQVLKVLDDHTLADLLNKPGSPRPLCEQNGAHALTVSARSK